MPNESFREDDELVRYGCMNGLDLENFIDLILRRGLEYKGEETDDFAVIYSFSGASWKVSWLEHNYVESWSTKNLI